jgi:hypothetical protein
MFPAGASAEAEGTRFQAAIFESESQEIGKNFCANLNGIGGSAFGLPNQDISAGDEKRGKL